MNFNSVLCFVNLDDYIKSDDLSCISSFYEDVDKECEDNHYYKGILVSYSNHDISGVRKVVEKMYSLRRSNNIVFGKSITRDSDCYYYFGDFEKDSIKRKRKLIRSCLRYYGDILKIEKVMLLDDGLEVPDKEIKVPIEVKKKKLVMKNN